MKKIMMIIVAFISFATHAQLSKSYTEKGNIFKIDVATKKITIDKSRTTIEISVYKNNKSLQSIDLKTGHYIGCSNNQNAISVENIEGKGWIISGLKSVCGNTNSEKTIYIFPKNDGYYSLEIDSKRKPIVKTENGNQLSIWYSYQEFGGGGTSTSYFVPRKLVIMDEENKITIKKGNVLKGLDEIDAEKLAHSLNFPNLFTAGILDHNPELLEFALKNYFKPEDKDWYAVHKIPTNKEEIDYVIIKLKALDALQKDFNKYPFMD